MTNATHTVTTVEAVDFAKLARENAQKEKELQEEKDAILHLDWSLSLLIECTNFGFDQLIEQKLQAERYHCTETGYKIEKILLDKYPASYRDWRDENNFTDFSCAKGGEQQ